MRKQRILAIVIITSFVFVGLTSINCTFRGHQNDQIGLTRLETSFLSITMPELETVTVHCESNNMGIGEMNVYQVQKAWTVTAESMAMAKGGFVDEVMKITRMQDTVASNLGYSPVAADFTIIMSPDLEFINSPPIVSYTKHVAIKYGVSNFSTDSATPIRKDCSICTYSKTYLMPETGSIVRTTLTYEATNRLLHADVESSMSNISESKGFEQYEFNEAIRY